MTTVFLRVDGVVLMDTESPAMACDELVIRLYREYLQREPDAIGYAYWIRQCQNGMSEMAMREEFRAAAAREKPTPQPPPPSGSDLWTSGVQVANQPIQSYTVTPSAEWLANPKGTLLVTGGYTPIGITPSFVTYTVAGVTQTFNGSNQAWSFDRDFPDKPPFPTPTGPFTLTVALLDADKQPMSGAAVSVQVNHN